MQGSTEKKMQREPNSSVSVISAPSLLHHDCKYKGILREYAPWILSMASFRY